MNHARHIIRKDLRRLQWLLVAWIFVIAGHLLLTVARSAVGFEGFGVQLAVENLLGLVAFIELLMLVLIVSWLVHDEPLVGNDAFWLTRPIEPSGLMTAKLVLAAGLLVFGPVVGDVLLMGWFGAGSSDVARAAPSFVFNQALWVLMLLALAVLTPTLTRFFLTIAGCVAAFVVVIGTVMALLLLRATDEATYDGVSVAPDGTPTIVLQLLLMCASLAVIVYQYRTRRLRRAILIGVGGVAVAVAMSSMWPWHIARNVEPDPGPWAHDVAETRAVLDPAVPPNVSDVHSLRGGTVQKKHVAARVDLTGAPPEYSVQSVGIRARLSFPDGTTIQSAQMEGVGVRRASTDRPLDRTARLRAVLGSVRLASNTEENYETLPVVLTVADQDYARYGRQAGHLTATADFYVNRFRILGALPLTIGAVLRDEVDRFEIVRVLRRSDGCDVQVRQFRVGAFGHPLSRREFHHVLRNAARGEAIEGDNQGMLAMGMSGVNLAGLFGFAVEGSGRGFSVWSFSLRYPNRTLSAATTAQVDAAWLDGAELVVIESAPAGHVSRALDVGEFRMGGQE